METKLIELYLLICRFYDTQPVLKHQRLSNNHEPLFSDEELLTLYIFGHLQGMTTQRRIYDYTRNHWCEWFPFLPAYQTVNCRLNELVPAFELLIEQLLTSNAWHVGAANDRLVDSVPVMLARGTVQHLHTIYQGANDVLLTIELRFCSTITALDVRRAVARLKSNIQARYPDIRRVFFGAESFTADGIPHDAVE